MLSFRQKVFISYLGVFLAFIAIIFLFSQQTVKDIVKKGMNDRATELISKIENASDNVDLINTLKDQKALIFFRVSVIDNQRRLLYDSHTKHILGDKFDQEHVVDHPEVLQAIKEGTGYNEEYSQLLGQELSYFAKTFFFHGKKYIIRTAFHLKYLKELIRDFEVGFLISSIVTLLLSSLMTWFIINYLTYPIHQIIAAVKPYQEGLSTSIPTIRLKPVNRTDEFAQLANTLNSLSVKIRGQINTLMHERNEKEAVLESLAEGVIAVDSSMKVIFVNTMALKLLGLQMEDLKGQIFTTQIQEKCFNLLKECQKQDKILNDTTEIKRDRDKIYLDLVAAPKKESAGAIIVLQDKTAHYKIGEMRKDFVANASHELKTPITIIRGFAEALHDNPELPQETYREITEKIMRNCKKMDSLIKDLLILTDIDHIPESRLIDCDLYDLALSCAETIQDAYPEANIEVKKLKDRDFHLLADPNLLELAILNLMENAAKYSTSPAQISVTLDGGNDWITISISDKGIGIPKGELEKIFQRFYRVEKPQVLKVRGSGLGLSIVETIISKHFGRVHVESELGKGSIFIIYLPSKRGL